MVINGVVFPSNDLICTESDRIIRRYVVADKVVQVNIDFSSNDEKELFSSVMENLDSGFTVEIDDTTYQTNQAYIYIKDDCDFKYINLQLIVG